MDFNQADFDHIQKRFQSLSAERSYLTKKRDRERSQLQGLEQRLEYVRRARAVVQVVAQQMQKNLEQRMSALVTMALAAVFPDDPYEFKLEIVERRKKTECDVWFVRRGKAVDPMAGSGGGVKDVASFAARLAFWALDKKSRPVVIMDEPFKFLHSPEYQRNCSEMLSTLAERLGMQMIIVTDQRDIDGDLVIDISKKEERRENNSNPSGPE